MLFCTCITVNGSTICSVLILLFDELLLQLMVFVLLLYQIQINFYLILISAMHVSRRYVGLEISWLAISCSQISSNLYIRSVAGVLTAIHLHSNCVYNNSIAHSRLIVYLQNTLLSIIDTSDLSTSLPLLSVHPHYTSSIDIYLRDD